MKAIQSINRMTTKVCELIMVIFALIMVLACFAQICTRLAGVPLSWSEELARYMAVWLTFIGAAYALRKESLATVEILYNKLQGVSKKSLYILISILVFLFSVILIRYGFAFALKFMGQKSPALQIPKGTVYLCAPISGILIFLYQIELLVNSLRKENNT